MPSLVERLAQLQTREVELYGFWWRLQRRTTVDLAQHRYGAISPLLSLDPQAIAAVLNGSKPKEGDLAALLQNLRTATPKAIDGQVRYQLALVCACVSHVGFVPGPGVELEDGFTLDEATGIAWEPISLTVEPEPKEGQTSIAGLTKPLRESLIDACEAHQDGEGELQQLAATFRGGHADAVLGGGLGAEVQPPPNGAADDGPCPADDRAAGDAPERHGTRTAAPPVC